MPLRALIERNPELEPSAIVDMMMGCGFCEGEQGYNIGRVAGAARRDRPPRPRHDRQPLLRLVAADHADGLPRDQGRRGRHLRRRRRRGRLARRRRRRFRVPPQLDGSEGAVYNVYIPMGLTAENVAERCRVSRESQDEWAVISQNRAVEASATGPLRQGDRAGHGARAQGRRQGGQRDRRARDGRHPGRRPSARDDDGEALRAAAGLQGRTAPSPPATPARSTTARPRC